MLFYLTNLFIAACFTEYHGKNCLLEIDVFTKNKSLLSTKKRYARSRAFTTSLCLWRAARTPIISLIDYQRVKQGCKAGCFLHPTDSIPLRTYKYILYMSAVYQGHLRCVARRAYTREENVSLAVLRSTMRGLKLREQYIFTDWPTDWSEERRRVVSSYTALAGIAVLAAMHATVM